MEKEEKGLFQKLLDFWREKISGEERDGIGFLKEKISGEKWDGIGFRNEQTSRNGYFAEMGAVDALNREEVKNVFWGGDDEDVGKKQQKTEMFSGNLFQYGMDLPEEKKSLNNAERQTDFFTPEIFRADDEEERHENEMGKMFFSDTEEKEKRMIIPIAAEGKQENASAEEGFSGTERIIEKKAEKMTEPTVDIDDLMRQITRRLWEEREGCGRRLR